MRSRQCVSRVRPAQRAGCRPVTSRGPALPSPCEASSAFRKDILLHQATETPNREPLANAYVLAQNIEFGNAGDMDTQETGWFVGFSDWTKGASSQLPPRLPTNLLLGYASRGSLIRQAIQTANSSR